MNDLIQKCLAVCSGIIAKILGVDFIILLVWFGLVVVDIITGLAKAKLTKDPIISQKLTDGVTRKLVPMIFVFAFHWATIAIHQVYGFSLGVLPATFAMFYVLGELKSIAENLQQANILLPPNWSEKLDHIFNTNHKCK